MVPSPLNRAIRNTLLHLQGADALPDTELLNRFVSQHDEAAFAELAQRHGPMVLRVCQRILGDPQLGEDAFQAVFIILAHKAASLVKPGWPSIGGWLHKIAWQTARRAKRNHLRRRARERSIDELSPDKGPTRPSSAEPVWRDLRTVLDEEIGHLPDKYRSCLVLCYLEGKTAEEVARLLGCPRKTVLTRLDRGRGRLRGRLARRGLALSAGALAAALAESTAPAAIPLATLQALVPAGLASGATVREGAAILAKETLQAMFWGKIRWGGIFLACLLMLGTAAVKWTGATGKPVANANVSASEGDDFYVRWRFDNGPPKDIRVIAGDPWEWSRPAGKKPGMMLAPRTIILLPTKVSKRPFVVSVKISGGVRRGQLSVIGAYWGDEQLIAGPRQRWMYITETVPVGKWSAYFAGRWVLTRMEPKGPKIVVFEVERYRQAYPTQTVVLELVNMAIGEIELRGLRPEELPLQLQNPEATVKAMRGPFEEAARSLRALE